MVNMNENRGGPRVNGGRPIRRGESLFTKKDFKDHRHLTSGALTSNEFNLLVRIVELEDELFRVNYLLEQKVKRANKKAHCSVCGQPIGNNGRHKAGITTPVHYDCIDTKSALR